MNAPASSTRHISNVLLRPALTGLLVICLVGYAFFLVQHSSPYAGGADSSGYLNSARLFSQGEFFARPRVLPGHAAGEFGGFSFVPLGFMRSQDGRMVPTYPTGYPIQLLAAAGFGWARAATVVNVSTALASGLLLFAFCRRLGFSLGLALGGVALLWACPLFIFSATQPMSDLSALGWSLAVLYSALRGRDSWKWGLPCGAAMGFAVLVRPTNLLLGVPVLVALGFRPRSWMAVGLGGLPGALFFCFYNSRVYGSPWITGYADVWSLFRMEHLPPNLAHFARWIPLLLSPLVILALVAPVCAAGRQRGIAVLGAWAATLVAFYAFYYHSGETWWYLRFILPAFPALILAALAALESAWRKHPSRPRTTAAALALVLLGALGWELAQVRQLHVREVKASERTYPDAANWAQQHLPDSSVIFCMQVSGAFFYYTDFLLLRWDVIIPGKYGVLLDTIVRQNRPVYAALFPFETAEAQRLIGGHWVKLSTVGQVTFWQRLP